MLRFDIFLQLNKEAVAADKYMQREVGFHLVNLIDG
jgi:hypothetical protein